MPQDPTISAMLQSYDKTAQRLMDGDKIEGDELYRFLGVTGVLSVQMQRQLWTQEELRENIAREQKEQCKACPNSKAIEVIMAGMSAKSAVATESTPNLPAGSMWPIFAKALAANMKTLIISAVAAVLIATVTAIVSGRVAEVAAAVASTSNAIRDR